MGHWGSSNHMVHIQSYHNRTIMATSQKRWRVFTPWKKLGKTMKTWAKHHHFISFLYFLYAHLNPQTICRSMVTAAQPPQKSPSAAPGEHRSSSKAHSNSDELSRRGAMTLRVKMEPQLKVFWPDNFRKSIEKWWTPTSMMKNRGFFTNWTHVFRDQMAMTKGNMLKWHSIELRDKHSWDFRLRWGTSNISHHIHWS